MTPPPETGRNAAPSDEPTLVGAPRPGNDPDTERTPGPQAESAASGSEADLELTLGAPGAVPAGAGPAATKVGHYTILGRLGEGGMGVVYKALQENPRREVALKIIRGGTFVDEQSVRMFQREAQVLGRLKHPGIAAIYECGITADGQHYFAMELVRGKPLQDFYGEQAADTSRAAVRRKLQLFLSICEAVSYAHQRGIIHRDLKPANILVQQPEAASVRQAEPLPEIKVLDFGLARITEDELGGASLATQPGTIMGTVPYMSPEQVRGQTDQVDVRSDEYALAVILYEMLAGRLPYDLHRASLPEAARRICEQPPAPMPQGVGRELATILNKALEKAPEQRYQSVAALGDDLQRWLHGQPIQAQPPSTIYQMRKLVARHKLGFGFAFAMVALLAGFAASMTLAARRIATQRDRANREAEVAQQVSTFLTNLFQISKPEQARGRTVTARELLDKGAAGIQADRSMDPEVKASLLDTMGGAYSSLGLFQQSEPLLRTALALRTALFGAESEPAAQTLRDLGVLALDRGDMATARSDYERALAIYQKSEGPVNADVAKLLNDLGGALEGANQLSQAQQYFQRALAMRIQLEGPNSAELIPMRTNLAYIAYARQDYAGAEEQFRQELAAAKAIYGPDHPFVAKIENNLGGVLFTEKKYAEAERHYAAALALNRKLLGNAHPEIGLDLANIAEARDAEGDLAAAERDYRQALGILQAKVPAGDERLRFVELNLGSVLAREQDPAKLHEAESMLRAVLASDRKAMPAGSWEIADAESELGGCLLAEGKLAEAEPLLVGSFPTLRGKLGANDPASVPRALDRIVSLYGRLGQPAKAQPFRALQKSLAAGVAGTSSPPA